MKGTVQISVTSAMQYGQTGVQAVGANQIALSNASKRVLRLSEATTSGWWALLLEGASVPHFLSCTYLSSHLANSLSV